MKEVQFSKPHHTGSKQLFKNPVLEKLTHTHIAVPISIFLLFSFSMLFCAIALSSLDFILILVLFTTGLILFTLIEYLAHRYVYHMNPKGEKMSNLQYMMHGVHHDYPRDKSRLAMPPIVSVMVAGFLLGITYVCMGEHTFAFLPGFVLGYASYLFVHYIVHAYHPPKNIFRTLWVNHSVHHYKDSDKAFGVSSPLWDYVFGTMPEKKKS